MDELEIQRASYPRVSDVIAKQNKHELSAIPIENLVNASIRGSHIHSYCTMYMKNLWIDEINPEYAPYFEAFKAWHKENIEKSLFLGFRLYDDKQLFTGEFDMIVQLKTGKSVLLDLKTSSAPSKAWPIQLAAYRHLCSINNIEVDEVLNLHLHAKKAAKFEKNEKGEKVMISLPEVEPRVIEYKNINQYWDIFASALTCYDYFDKKEKK